MRANQKFIKEVRARVKEMTEDKALSYLRGTTNHGFIAAKANPATTKLLAELRQSLMPEPPPAPVVTVENEKESFKKKARRKSF